MTYADVPPEHVCAFSYMGIGHTSMHITYHTYMDEKGNSIQCEVLLYTYYHRYECACGAFENRPFENNKQVVHTKPCGQ